MVGPQGSRGKDLRVLALDLMKREQRLEQIVRLIGPDALPEGQRLILVTAELIKNGFLQQSSFDEVDRYCVPEKQLLILRIILDFHQRAEAAMGQGVPLAAIVALPERERISRLKAEVPNDRIDGLQAVLRELGPAFDGLVRNHAGEGAP